MWSLLASHGRAVWRKPQSASALFPVSGHFEAFSRRCAGSLPWQLRALGIHQEEHDIRFVEDDWESPTLGAWGLGWEVWLNGMEVSQFTYFQQVGGIDCKPILGEITYGLERLAMYLQGVENVYD